MSRKVAVGSNRETNPTSPAPLPMCNHCQQPALLLCARCIEAWYCSPEHQVADWNSHKFQCKQRRKEKEKEAEKEKEKEKDKDREKSDDAITYLSLNPHLSLFIACDEGEVGRAREILLGGEDVNLQSPDGCTPAYFACQNGHTECLSLLINHGAQLDKATNEGLTPVYTACYHGHTECLSLLINHGAQLDKASNGGATPAWIACQNGHTECLSLLINHGAQLDKASNEGFTPAWIAYQNGHKSCLSLLMYHGWRRLVRVYSYRLLEWLFRGRHCVHPLLLCFTLTLAVLLGFKFQVEEVGPSLLIAMFF